MCIRATSNRSSEGSNPIVEPMAGTPPTGLAVLGTVRSMLPDIDGTPPGLETRRSTSRPLLTLSEPMKYPSVAAGSSLSTPCGE